MLRRTDSHELVAVCATSREPFLDVPVYYIGLTARPRSPTAAAVVAHPVAAAGMHWALAGVGRVPASGPASST